MKKQVEMLTESLYYPDLVSDAARAMLRCSPKLHTVANGIWAATRGALQVGWVESDRCMMVNQTGGSAVRISVNDDEVTIVSTGIDMVYLSTSGDRGVTSKNPAYALAKFRQSHLFTAMRDLAYPMKALNEIVRNSILESLQTTRYKMHQSAGTDDLRSITAQLSTESRAALLTMYAGELDRSTLPVEVRSNLDRMVTMLAKYKDVAQQLDAKIAAMFCKPKWVIGKYLHGIMVGEVNIDPRDIVDNKLNHEATPFSSQPRMYRSFNDVPEHIRPHLFSSLAMYKLIRGGITEDNSHSHNYKNVVKTDPDNYMIRGDGCSMEGGWLTWNRGSRYAQWLLVDKD